MNEWEKKATKKGFAPSFIASIEFEADNVYHQYYIISIATYIITFKAYIHKF